MKRIINRIILYWKNPDVTKVIPWINKVIEDASKGITLLK